MGTGGAAATVDVLATHAAVEALRDGANAVDAAVVAAGVLGVTEPFSCGIGGGGFMLIRTADGEVTTIDGRETAPAAMRPDSFREGGTPLPFDPARWSGLSAGVPGTVASWDLALRQFGTYSLRDALQAGIEVARSGFVVDQTFVDQTRTRRRRRRRRTSTTSTTSGRPRRCTSIRTARRRTSAPSSGTPISRARTSGSPSSAPRASTAARSRTRS